MFGTKAAVLTSTCSQSAPASSMPRPDLGAARSGTARSARCECPLHSSLRTRAHTMSTTFRRRERRPRPLATTARRSIVVRRRHGAELQPFHLETRAGSQTPSERSGTRRRRRRLTTRVTPAAGAGACRRPAASSSRGRRRVGLYSTPPGDRQSRGANERSRQRLVELPSQAPESWRPGARHQGDLRPSGVITPGGDLPVTTPARVGCGSAPPVGDWSCAFWIPLALDREAQDTRPA